MATTTTNLGLRKPAKTDYINVVTDLDDNMDTIDSSVNAAQEAVAIMSDGNTHIAVSSGEYLYVRNHASLSEGLYIATAAIAQNGTLSSSNVTAITRGIGGQVTQLYDRVGKIKRAGRGLTNTSTGIYTFTMENSTSAFIMITANVVAAYSTSNGSFYYGTLPSGYTLSKSDTTVTITKTASVSTAATIAYLVIGA